MRYKILVALILGLLALALAWPAHAEEPDRYQPSSRGPIRFLETEQVQQWRPLLEQYDWPVETALRVIACESEGKAAVWNREGSGAHGLFQLLGWEAKAFELYGVWSVADPEVNVGVAHYLYRAGGNRFNTRIGWSASAHCWG